MTSPNPTFDERALLEVIREVAQQHLKHAGPLTPDTRLVEALRLDSLRTLTLVMELENRLQVTLEEGDEQGVETVGQLITLLQRRLREAQHAEARRG